jgi:hypothetical protein
LNCPGQGLQVEGHGFIRRFRFLILPLKLFEGRFGGFVQRTYLVHRTVISFLLYPPSSPLSPPFIPNNLVLSEIETR